jgi:hypothetical protein
VSEEISREPTSPRKKKLKLKDEDLELEEEEDEEDEEEDERPRKKRKKSQASPLMALLPGTIATALLCVIPFSTLFSWFYLDREAKAAGSSKKESTTVWVTGWGYAQSRVDQGSGAKESEEPRLASESRPEGLLITLVSTVLALVAIAACVFLLLSRGRPQLDIATKSVVGAAMGGAVLMVVWFLSWVIKVVILSRKMQADMAGSEKIGAVEMTITYSPMPGLGLWLALGCATIGALGLSMSLAAVSKLVWRYVATAAGLVLGLMFMAALVQPWNVDDLNKGAAPLVSSKL